MSCSVYEVESKLEKYILLKITVARPSVYLQRTCSLMFSRIRITFNEVLQVPSVKTQKKKKSRGICLYNQMRKLNHNKLLHMVTLYSNINSHWTTTDYHWPSLKSPWSSFVNYLRHIHQYLMPALFPIPFCLNNELFWYQHWFGFSWICHINVQDNTHMLTH